MHEAIVLESRVRAPIAKVAQRINKLAVFGFGFGIHVQRSTLEIQTPMRPLKLKHASKI